MRALLLALALSFGPLEAQTVPAQEGNRGQPAQQQTTQTASPSSTKARPTPDERIADYTWWLTVLAAVTIGVGLLQWRVSNRQHTTMVEQEKLTRKTIDVMEQSNERSLRAYLSFRPDAVNAGRDDFGVGVRFRATITNRGQTPAYHLQLWTGSRVLGVPFPEQHVMVREESVGILAPSADITTDERDKVFLPVKDYPAYRAGEKRVYYFGVMQYEDAFRKRWEQRFCVYLSFEVEVGGKSVLATNETWNDEVCIHGQT